MLSTFESRRPPPRVSAAKLRVFVLFCVACGSAEETPQAGGQSGVNVEVGVVRCPAFVGYSILPASLPPGVVADVTVSVMDPDSTELELRWTATSGRFSKPTSARTKYECARVGDQVLTLSARDGDGCERKLNLDLKCLAE
jgi:hypothetical protein